MGKKNKQKEKDYPYQKFGVLDDYSPLKRFFIERTCKHQDIKKVWVADFRVECKSLGSQCQRCGKTWS
jgi:hypothetical protein